MVDQDELDEDIFADLYDADNSVKPSASAVKEELLKAEKTTRGSYDDSAPVPTTETAAPNGSDNNHYAQNEAPSNAGDAEMHGSSWNGNGNQGYEAAAETEDNYGPINVKEDGKMFIGGLNWETTEQSLKDYFSQFGEVSECTVMRDSATGRSRGFGFLTFKDPKCVNIVMVKEHYLDGKIIDPKRAIPREEQERTSKIFVGGVSQEATDHDFKEFFKQFGRVVDATLMIDKDTGRPRGFGFVTFDGDAAVDATLAGPLQILGKPIEVKRAQPRGNLRDGEEEKKFGRPVGGKFGGRNESQGGFEQQNQNQNGGTTNMSPAMMAQYWQRMQQYFQMMQQQIAGAGMANPAMAGGMPGGMNPAMMQQMMAMQGGAMNRPDSGSPQPQQQIGNPAMMQQMQQMQQMQMQQQQQPNPGYGGAAGMMNAARPAYAAQDQLQFEQQKYEQQQQQQARRMQQAGGYGVPGGPTSWEGMYDEVPQPAMPPQGPAAARVQNFPRGGGAPHARGRQGSSQPPVQPSNAPANAPTGPKNAGKPGSNYRGGNRHRGAGNFHPYHRG